MVFFSGFVLFAVIWFMTLFVVLPIRLKTQADVGVVARGTPASAPHNPQVKKRMMITTGIAVVLWLIAMVIIQSDAVSIRDIKLLKPMAPLAIPVSEPAGTDG